MDPQSQIRKFERRLDEIHAMAEWRGEIKDLEVIHSGDSDARQLYIRLKEPLPMPYTCGDDRFKKVFLYLKNSVHKGMWHVKSMEADRKEIICENIQRNDGTRISWELDIEMNHSPRIVQRENDFFVETQQGLNPFVMQAEPVRPVKPAFARLTPPVLISCRATILSISCINLVDQSFIADVFLVFNAHHIGKIAKQDTFKHIHKKNLDQATFDIDKAVKEFAEYYEFQKAIGFRHCRSKLDEIEKADFSHIGLSPDSEEGSSRYNYVFTCKRNAIYSSAFNLREYPFDEQKLTIAMIFNIDQYSARLYENFKSRSTFLDSHFHLSDSLFSVVNGKNVLTEISFSDPDFSYVGASYSVVDFSVTLRRRQYKHVLQNFILPVLMITSMSLLSFDADDFKDRLDITSSLLLAIVTYKLVLVDILPPFSYSTRLHDYVLFCFFYIAIVTFLGVHPEDGGSEGQNTEKLKRFGLLWLFILAHVCAYVYLKICIWDRQKSDDQKSREYDAKVQAITARHTFGLRAAVVTVNAVQHFRSRIARPALGTAQGGADPVAGVGVAPDTPEELHANEEEEKAADPPLIRARGRPMRPVSPVALREPPAPEVRTSKTQRREVAAEEEEEVPAPEEPRKKSKKRRRAAEEAVEEEAAEEDVEEEERPRRAPSENARVTRRQTRLSLTHR